MEVDPLGKIFTNRDGPKTLVTAIQLLVEVYRGTLEPLEVPEPLGSWLGANYGLSVLDALEGVLDDYQTTFAIIPRGQVLPPTGDVAAGAPGSDDRG